MRKCEKISCIYGETRLQINYHQNRWNGYMVELRRGDELNCNEMKNMVECWSELSDDGSRYGHGRRMLSGLGGPAATNVIYTILWCCSSSFTLALARRLKFNLKNPDKNSKKRKESSGMGLENGDNGQNGKRKKNGAWFIGQQVYLICINTCNE